MGACATQAQDLSGDSSSEEGSRYQVPGAGVSTSQAAQASIKGKLQWTDTVSPARRPPSAGPGLSLKQQASSPRWGARRGIGPALVSPGLQPRTSIISAVPLQRRSGQPRTSALGLPIRSRRAVSDDDSETEHAGTGGALYRAQSVSVPKHQLRGGGQPLIELSDLGTDHVSTAEQGFLTSPHPRLTSAESLPTWQAPHTQSAAPQKLLEQPDMGIDAEMSHEQDEDLKQKLLP